MSNYKPEYIEYLTKLAKSGDMQAYHQLERQGIYVDLSDDEETPSAMMFPRSLKKHLGTVTDKVKAFVGSNSEVKTRSKRQKYVRKGRKVIGVK